MIAAVPVSLFFSLFSLSLFPLTRVTSAEKLLCLLCKTCVSQLSDHHYVDILGKGRVF